MNVDYTNCMQEPVMVEYDDNNLTHVLSGPDYGQPWSEVNLDLLNCEEINLF